MRKRTVPDLSGKGKATRIFLPSRVNLEIKILAFPFTHASNGAVGIPSNGFFHLSPTFSFLSSGVCSQHLRGESSSFFSDRGFALGYALGFLIRLGSDLTVLRSGVKARLEIAK